jgi:putative membrane protein
MRFARSFTEENTMHRMILILIALVWSPVAFAQAPEQQTLSPVDKKFATEASQGNLAEVQLGEIALQKSQNADVKAFAQKMIDHHSQANNDLAQVLQPENVPLATEPNAKQKKTKERLSALSDAAFDREFAKVMVKDHQDVLKKYQAQAKKTKHTGLNTYIQKTIPVVASHLEEAQKLQQTTANQKQ